MTRQFFTDTVNADLTYAGDAVDGDVTPADAEMVTRDTPWESFFGTDEYVRFSATVAQPMIQPYHYNDEIQFFAKDAAELKQAQGQIVGLPWTMGHPPDNRLTDAENIRGYWQNPEYTDGQDAELYIPADDTEAIRFAVHNDNVSIGFAGSLDYDTSRTQNGITADAVQRDMVYNHIASVENGRCGRSDGCGIHADASDTIGSHGHVSGLNEVHTDAEMDPTYSEGDWLSWNWQGGTARGRVTNVSTSRALSANNGETTRDPQEEGEPVYKLKHWDNGSFGNMKVAYQSNLSEASEPDDFSDAAYLLAGAMSGGTGFRNSVDGSKAAVTNGGSAERTAAGDAVQSSMTEEGRVKYVHEDISEQLRENLYESISAAETAASEMGCNGVHPHEVDGETMWMPCNSMSTFENMNDMEHGAMTDSCGCHVLQPTFGRSCSDGPCSCGLHTTGDAEINGETIDLSVPDGAQSAAQAFLDAKEAGVVPDDCGTGVGTESARMIADDEVTAERLVSKIAPYLTSHEEDTTTDTHPTDWPMGGDDETETPWTDCGDAMYAAWGWHSLTEWAQSTADEIKRARGEDPVYTDALSDRFREGQLVRFQPMPSLIGRVDHNPDDANTVMVTWMRSDGSSSGYTTSQGPDDLLPHEAVMDPRMAEDARHQMDAVPRQQLVDAQHSAPRGIHVSDDGKWYGVAPSENADGEPKYELDNCNDVKDAYNLRKEGHYDIERQTLVDRIKRAESVHGCSDAQKPWTDTAAQLAATIAE